MPDTPPESNAPPNPYADAVKQRAAEIQAQQPDARPEGVPPAAFQLAIAGDFHEAGKVVPRPDTPPVDPPAPDNPSDLLTASANGGEVPTEADLCGWLTDNGSTILEADGRCLAWLPMRVDGVVRLYLVTETIPAPGVQVLQERDGGRWLAFRCPRRHRGGATGLAGRLGEPVAEPGRACRTKPAQRPHLPGPRRHDRARRQSRRAPVYPGTPCRGRRSACLAGFRRRRVDADTGLAPRAVRSGRRQFCGKPRPGSALGAAAVDRGRVVCAHPGPRHRPARCVCLSRYANCWQSCTRGDGQALPNTGRALWPPWKPWKASKRASRGKTRRPARADCGAW